MKKRICIFMTAAWVFLAVVIPLASAHTLFMNLVDNEDGSVTVEAMFSTGASGAGLPLYLEDADRKVIQRLTIDEDGEARFEIPDQPYTVFLDGGPGHTVRKFGPKK